MLVNKYFKYVIVYIYAWNDCCMFAVPPNLFLLGCIFVVVEIERYLDESIPGWQQKIEKHGGKYALNIYLQLYYLYILTCILYSVFYIYR